MATRVIPLRAVKMEARAMRTSGVTMRGRTTRMTFDRIFTSLQTIGERRSGVNSGKGLARGMA